MQINYYYYYYYYTNTTTTVLCLKCMFFVSARQQLHGNISPQSEYVRVLHDGVCVWWPMYERSMSHCPINVTHFPFDNQRCYLIFESWKYNSSQLYINSSLLTESKHHYQESEQWELLGR